MREDRKKILRGTRGKRIKREDRKKNVRNIRREDNNIRKDDKETIF